jgi:hypothetical protein
VGSIHNRFKLRHPWKEQLPERDLVYEGWCRRFRSFQQWVADIILSATKRGWSGKQFAEELVLRRSQGGRYNYKALKALGRDGLAACLNSWLSQETEAQMTRTQVQRFVREFFNWERT